MRSNKYLFFPGVLLAVLVVMSGCGKKKHTTPPPQQKTVQKPPAPRPAPPKTKYYVITGSFLYPENEKRFEGMMRDEGFSPIPLPGDSGFHRVGVFSFDNEAEARQKLQEVRSSSPRFRDAWLLIK